MSEQRARAREAVDQWVSDGSLYGFSTGELAGHIAQHAASEVQLALEEAARTAEKAYRTDRTSYVGTEWEAARLRTMFIATSIRSLATRHHEASRAE